MNLKIKDWEESYKYAKNVCIELKNKGYIVGIKPYVMYNNNKGIYFNVFDNEGILFNSYASGIHTNVDDMKKSIKRIESRIIGEC